LPYKTESSFTFKKATMTKGNKIILGIVTMLPFLAMVLYFSTIVLLVRDAISHCGRCLVVGHNRPRRWSAQFWIDGLLYHSRYPEPTGCHKRKNHLGHSVRYRKCDSIPHLLVSPHLEKTRDRYHVRDVGIDDCGQQRVVKC
jgi:hypothetical protein